MCIFDGDEIGSIWKDSEPEIIIGDYVKRKTIKDNDNFVSSRVALAA